MFQILNLVGGIATEWLRGKQAEGQAKQQAKLRQINNDASWENTQARGSMTSWKDEWFVVILSIPMVGAFIPELVPYIQQGFGVLDTMPDYYKAFLGAAIAASFGIKTLANWKK